MTKAAVSSCLGRMRGGVEGRKFLMMPTTRRSKARTRSGRSDAKALEREDAMKRGRGAIEAE